MKTFLKWIFFLSKRLYKKVTFLVLLLLIPLSALALKLASAEDSGFVRVALVNEAKGNAFSENLIEDLRSSTRLLRFTVYDTEDDALKAMYGNKVDSVWIFPEELEEKIERYVESRSGNDSFIRVLQKEDSVINRMALERLSGTIYPHLSRKIFLNYIRGSDRFDLNDMTDEELFAYYDQFYSEDPLFSFDYPDGGTADPKEPVHFLTAPIRGMLAVIVMLCGMAAAMLFSQDEKRGVFAWAKPSSRFWISIASQLTAVAGTAIMMFFAVFFLGANVSFLRETGILLLFILNATLFCTVLQQGIKRVNVLATTVTILTVLMLIVCPIFFDTRMFKIPQLLFPVTYYIQSAYNNTYLLYSLLYGAVLSGILFLLSLWRCRR